MIAAFVSISAAQHYDRAGEEAAGKVSSDEAASTALNHKRRQRSRTVGVLRSLRQVGDLRVPAALRVPDALRVPGCGPQAVRRPPEAAATAGAARPSGLQQAAEALQAEPGAHDDWRRAKAAGARAADHPDFVRRADGAALWLSPATGRVTCVQAVSSPPTPPSLPPFPDGFLAGS